MSDSKALTPMETFQEKVRNRLRDDIAGLLPDDALAAMVQRVVEEEFFTKRQKHEKDGWSTRTVEVPSPFQAMVMEAAKPLLQQLAKEWFEANQEHFVAHWKKVVDTGLMEYVEKLHGNMATEALRQQLNTMVQAWNTERASRGMSPLPVTFF